MLEPHMQTIFLIAISVFTSSFLGSLHCFGMCGPIVLATNKTLMDSVQYHLGRLMGYLLLGGSVGFLGRELLGAFPHSYAALIAPLFMGGAFIFMGVLLFQNKRFHFPIPNVLTLSYNKFVALKAQKNLPFASLLIGFSSIFLPCGWLYGFVVGAAATESLTISLVIMFMFWLGTLPALFFTPVVFEKIIAPLRAKFPTIASIVLIVAGVAIITIAMRRVL